MISNVYQMRRTKRKRQLAEIKVACARLVERKCKCGCSLKFRVFPESELVYGSASCAQKAGWRPRWRFEPAYDESRRWVWITAGIDAPQYA